MLFKLRLALIFLLLNKIEANSINQNYKIDNFRDQLGKRIASFLDETIDPCENFYEYACGNWDSVVGNYTLPMENGYSTPLSLLNDNILKLIENSTTTGELGKYEKAVQNAIKFYESCLNTDIYSTAKVSEYLDLLKSIGGFPAADQNWSSKNFSWVKMLAHTHAYGSKLLFEVEQNAIHPFKLYKRSKFEFGIGVTLTLVDVKEKVSLKYHQNYGLLKYYLNRYNIRSDTDKVIEEIFELIEALIPLGENDEYEILPDLEAYYEILLNRSDLTNLKLINITLPFVNFLNEAKPDVLANYFSLKLLHHLHSELTLPKSQKQFCNNQLYLTMRYCFANIYVEEYFSGEIELEINHMFNVVKESYKGIVRNSILLDDKTRNGILLEIEKYKLITGKILDPIFRNLTAEIFENIEITENYFTNNVNLMKAKKLLDFYHFVNGAGNQSQETHSLDILDINAYYLRGVIYVMMGILSPPYYDLKFPKSLKYGSFGSILGHEMSHGFDSVLETFDENDERKQYWTNDAFAVYKLNIQCFVEQYSKLHFAEVEYKRDSHRTSTENIADSGGIRLAFEAYKKISKIMEASELEMEVLPHVNLTNTQLFFVAHAQLYCKTYFRTDFEKEMNSIDDHSFIPIRINGALSNYEEFSKEFNCPVGAKMNPIGKCKIF